MASKDTRSVTGTRYMATMKAPTTCCGMATASGSTLGVLQTRRS